MAKILLLEPDRQLAQSYRLACQAAGHEAVVRHSAQAAIFAVDEQRPDVIFVELQLVGHSGIEFLYELRSYPEWQAIPVMVISYVPWRDLKGSQRLLREQLRISEYFYKPELSLKRLTGAIDSVLAAV